MVSSAFSVEFDKTVPKNIQDQIVQDLAFINGVKLTKQSGLHGKIFGKLSSNAYNAYFLSRIENVVYDNDPNSTAMAYVSPLFGKTMFLANNYIKYKQPQIYRASIVFHEARHTEAENGHWTHAECPVPFLDENGKEIVGSVTGVKLAGEYACDTTELGAYATGAILAKNVSKYCENCGEKVKMDGDILATEMLKRIIDKKAKDLMLKDYAE